MERFSAPLARVAPGLGAVGILTAAAFLAAPWTRPLGLGPTALGVGLGVLAGNLARPGPRWSPGIRFAGSRVLALAVVLLGLEVTVTDLLGLGATTAGIVLLVVIGGILLAVGVGRAMGISPGLAGLIGAGTGICGVSAIAAVRSGVDARETEVAYAVASITLLGSIGLVVYPLVQLATGWLPATDFGVLAGATLHSTPQALGAAFAGGGDAAGAPATVVKLARVVLLGPVALALAVAYRHADRVDASVLAVPGEVLGFLALFVLGSLVALPADLLAGAALVTDAALVAALTALGLATRFADLRRAGVAPLALAGVAWGALIGLVLLVLYLA